MEIEQVEMASQAIKALDRVADAIDNHAYETAGIADIADVLRTSDGRNVADALMSIARAIEGLADAVNSLKSD